MCTPPGSDSMARKRSTLSKLSSGSPIPISTTEETLSLEDSILVAFLNLVGFDILFFVPTGYQSIEKYFQKPFANEHQLGPYRYDLQVPDFRTLHEGGKSSIRKLFGRSF